MLIKFNCECCGSSYFILNEEGEHVCSYCGAKYVYSYQNKGIQKNLTKEEFNVYLIKLAKRLIEDNTPVDILPLNIKKTFKIIVNDNEEFHFLYEYEKKEYIVIFDNLGIKKIQIPPNNSYIIQKKSNDKKFLILYLISILFFGVLSIFWNISVIALIVSIFLLLSKNLLANNKIIEEQKKEKEKNFEKFMKDNNFQNYNGIIF